MSNNLYLKLHLIHLKFGIIGWNHTQNHLHSKYMNYSMRDISNEGQFLLLNTVKVLTV